MLPPAALYARVVLQPVLQRRALYVCLDVRHGTRGVEGPIAAQARRMSIVLPVLIRLACGVRTL